MARRSNDGGWVFHCWECLRCGYRWETDRYFRDKRIGEKFVPKRCAKCRSPLWNQPRRYKLANRNDSASDLLPRKGSFLAGRRR